MNSLKEMEKDSMEKMKFNMTLSAFSWDPTLGRALKEYFKVMPRWLEWDKMRRIVKRIEIIKQLHENINKLEEELRVEIPKKMIELKRNVRFSSFTLTEDLDVTTSNRKKMTYLAWLNPRAELFYALEDALVPLRVVSIKLDDL